MNVSFEDAAKTWFSPTDVTLSPCLIGGGGLLTKNHSVCESSKRAHDLSEKRDETRRKEEKRKKKRKRKASSGHRD